MATLTIPAATFAITALVVLALRVATAANSRASTLAARRRTGLLQLTKWGVLGLGAMVIAGELLVAFGVASGTLAVFLAAGVTGLAFAIREPVADFFAAAALLMERTAAVGDEVELNGEVRGTLAGFGLRSVAVVTWDGDTVYHTASTIRSFRNLSKSESRAVTDIVIPSSVRVGRATSILMQACSEVADGTFRSRPEVLGVVRQELDHYVLRLTCFVDPARHRLAEYRLRAAAVDAVAEMMDQGGNVRDTAEVMAILGHRHIA